MAGASLIDIEHVHHFKTGLVHLVVWIEVGVGGKTGFRYLAHDGRVRVAPPFESA